MKTFSLFFLALILTITGFSQSKSKGSTVVKDETNDFWYIPVFCDGEEEEVGTLVGAVTYSSVIHNNKFWFKEKITGTLDGTGVFEGETFELKFHAKYIFSEGFRMELHFIAKGDKGSKIIAKGYFTPSDGHVSLKGKCM